MLNLNKKKPDAILKIDNKAIENKYTKVKCLKEGGFGKAYLCKKVSDNSLCVIKEMKTKS